jgi:spermidine/putrescine transport system permease protein
MHVLSKFNQSLPWQSLLSVLVFGFMYLPILVLTLYSFNDSNNSAEWQGFTLKWYGQFFQDDRILSALRNSLTVAVCAVAVAAVLGTLMAVGLARCVFWGKSLYQGMAYLPLIIPDISIAVATLVFLAAINLPLSLWTIVAAHIVFCLSYVALVVSTRIGKLHPQLEEAALDLGATPVQAFMWVILPELTPAIISGCLLAFVLSMDDLLIASFTASPDATTLPMLILSRIHTQIRPDINALSVVLIVVSGIVALGADLIRHRSEQKRLQ